MNVALAALLSYSFFIKQEHFRTIVHLYKLFTIHPEPGDGLFIGFIELYVTGPFKAIEIIVCGVFTFPVIMIADRF